MIQPCNIDFDKRQVEHLKLLESYVVNILVNGRYFKDLIILVRSKGYGNQDIDLINDSDARTTIYFNNPFHVRGIVDTVDVIIRDQNGKATHAFLDVELLNV